ncbi:MAG: phenylalanine--tRNA ligase subunit beta, partial [Bacteroidota bacterium]
MKISLNWLKELVEFDCSVEELAAILTMRGLEVEHIARLGEKYKNFVVGEIFEMNNHPNAEKLSLCTVDIGKGKEKLKIVCGAPNAQEGQYVVVALVGAVIPRDQHNPNGEPFVLTKSKIRGEDSNGMLCSKYELDLGDDADGIYVLEDKTVEKVGITLADYLGVNDTVLEIGVTPNRPDCLCHVGVAREIASHFKTKLELPSSYISEIKEQTKNFAAVRIEAEELCPRYSARVLKNVKVAPSPQWLQRRLEAVGVRPVNNIVDVTNYILMETGQPLHAFDLEKVERETVVIKGAKEGETFTTLDGKERKLKFETLMICDPKKSIAMAGILGGRNSEISEATKIVLIESAYFQARSIRRTSKYFGISTDASQRFERGTDPNITDYAATRAAQLMSELAGGDVLKGVLDVYPEKIFPQKIMLRVDRTNQVLGTELSSSEIRTLLESIDFEVAKGIRATKDALTFVVPSFRPDITSEIDLIEEVARIYGYDNIETKMRITMQTAESIPPLDIVDSLRDYLAHTGWSEVVANSMQEKSVASLGADKIVEMLNPMSSDMAALRTSLVP